MVASCVITVFVMPSEIGLPGAVVVGLLEGSFGAAIATLLLGRFRQTAAAKKVITIALLLLAVAGNAGLFVFAHNEETLDEISAYRPPRTDVRQISAPNPATPGAFRVRTLTYGSGTDSSRTEYGPAVMLKTHSVDASKLFRDFHGWKRTVRRWYWGFDIDNLPLNARVWYADGVGPFPLVLIVHGNHAMTEPSERGYAYLGELLASRGFILASTSAVTQNRPMVVT
jgi:hypothetical protein